MSSPKTLNSILPISLAAVPTAYGAPNAGTVLGPSALLHAGLATALRSRGRRIATIASLAVTPALGVSGGPEPIRANNAASIARATRSISNAALRLLRQRTLPVFLGGDHSIAMGTIGGAARYCRETGRELFVLWLDAHADYNTPATSPTGNMHGMALAMLTGEEGFAAAFDGSSYGALAPANALLFGTRSLDPGERPLLRRRGIICVGREQIAGFGLRLPLERFLERVRLAGGILHVSFDVDVLDPSVAPGVGTPVQGGLSEGQACQIFNLLRDSGLVRSLDIVELDPTRDHYGRTARTVVRLVSGMFGTGHQVCKPSDKEYSHDRNAA